MRKILHVVGARPNFVKVAPIHRIIALRARFDQCVVHTGQHYDAAMSDVFLDELGMPAPDVRLAVGSGSHAVQTARMMVRLERVLDAERPDLLTVVGDTNGALAAALVAAKTGVRIAHVEAGLRSFDRAMPEETNRVVVDHLADVHLTPSADANANLAREGIGPDGVHLVGNVMIDTLLASIDRAREQPTLRRLGLTPREYAVCTLHRPSNVDYPERLLGLLDVLAGLAGRLPVVFSVHPRTRRAMADPGARAAIERSPGLRLVPPLRYLEFLALTSQARLVLTDSGGVQEESTVLGVPCLTLRDNTERPITVEQGTNQVVGTDPAAVSRVASNLLDGAVTIGSIPDLWDGHAAERIVDVYESELGVGAVFVH